MDAVESASEGFNSASQIGQTLVDELVLVGAVLGAGDDGRVVHIQGDERAGRCAMTQRGMISQSQVSFEPQNVHGLL